MVPLRASGFGAVVELADTAVVIHSGYAAAKIQGTDTITVPYGNITSVEYHPADPLVNGSLRLVIRTAGASWSDMVTTAGRGDGATANAQVSQRVREYAETFQSYGGSPRSHVSPNMLVVYWLSKDEAGFEAVRDAINARIGIVAVPSGLQGPEALPV
jgi:hypothetical protein